MAKVVKRGEDQKLEVIYQEVEPDPELDVVQPGVWRVRRGCVIHTGTKREGPFTQGTELSELTKRQLIHHGFKLERVDEPGKSEPDWLKNPSAAVLMGEHIDVNVRAQTFMAPPQNKQVKGPPKTGPMTEESTTLLVEGED